MATPFIPVNTPRLDGREEQYLVDCIRTGWVSSEGAYVSRFEDAFAERLGRSHGIAVSSGTSALEIAVAALGIGPGDEVILPTFTIISCAAAVVRSGATPVVVDADPDTWCMNVDRLEECVGPRTRAIMPVHIYGLPVDMGPVLDIAARNDLFVIEDAAEAHGLDWNGRPCGSFGNVSIFSFYANKLITTGEGGMALTDDKDLAERLRTLRNLSFGRDRRFRHEAISGNHRMTNLQAAVGLAQFERLDEFLQRKREIGRLYRTLLEECRGISLQPESVGSADNVYWVVGVVLDDDVPLDADAVMARLREYGIGTRPFFWPMHLQPALRDLGLFSGSEQHPVAERISRRGFYLPSGLGLSDDDVVRSAQALRDVLSRALK